MNSLTLRTILFFSSHRSSSCSFLSLQISHFSSSSRSPYHPSSSSSRWYEEESKNVRVSVWWDFENCALPASANVFRVAYSITAAVRANGIKGPIQITAFGDIVQLSRSNQEALSSTGINLTHIPHGGKNSADRSLLVDLLYWVSQNPPPAHLFLISGDRDFASVLHRLRMNNYNILLASPESAPGVLCSSASIMWHWHALVRGENLTVKHFNQPPDGPYGSWYGHYKVPLEDPFSLNGQPACSRAVELSEPAVDVKPRPIPKAVMKQIRHILNSFPKGISITELRLELSKANVTIDKDLYGYKKLSRFLFAMPHILKLQSAGDGQFIVRGTTLKVPEPVESNQGASAVSVSDNGDQDLTITPKSNGEDRPITKAVNGKSSSPPSPEVNVEEPPRKVQESPLLEKNIENVINAHVTEDHLAPVEEQDAAYEVGFFRKIWRKWFFGDDGASGKKSHSIPEECSTSGDSSEKKKSEKKSVKSVRKSADQVGPASRSLPSNESASKDRSATNSKCGVKSVSPSADPVGPASRSLPSNVSALEDKAATNSELYGDKSGTTPGYFSKVLNWFKFWSGGPNSDTSRDQSSERPNQINGHPGKHGIFSMDSFWSEMESFIDMPKGSVLVVQSKTRLQMAHNLQTQGPLVLGSLNESDLVQLVDLLISEKKWVEECPFQPLPFKLSRAIRSSYLDHSRGSNALSSIFLGTPSQSDLPGLPEQDREKRYQNPPHNGLSMSVTNKKPSDRSRSEILADCQKLVDELLKDYPEGYDIGSFRKLFLERYGYSLDLPKLGYSKLASFLQVLSGVKMESTYIIPSTEVSKVASPEIAIPNMKENARGTVINSDSELSDASRKDDLLGSPWEELGPVVDATSNRNEMESGLSRKAKETARQTHFDYEPSVSDDDFSDSEGETPSSAGSEGLGKPRMTQEESSLLQILDSCYSSKEDNNRMDGSENVDGMVNCSRNAVKSSGSSGAGLKCETHAPNFRRKQRPIKSYTFVSDSGEDSKDKMIDGILGSLKTSCDSRMRT